MINDGWSEEYRGWMRLYLLRLEEERLRHEMVEYLNKFKKPRFCDQNAPEPPELKGAH